MTEQEKQLVETMRLAVEHLLIGYDEFGVVSGRAMYALRQAMVKLNKVIK